MIAEYCYDCKDFYCIECLCWCAVHDEGLYELDDEDCPDFEDEKLTDLIRERHRLFEQARSKIDA